MFKFLDQLEWCINSSSKSKDFRFPKILDKISGKAFFPPFYINTFNLKNKGDNTFIWLRLLLEIFQIYLQVTSTFKSIFCLLFHLIVILAMKTILCKCLQNLCHFYGLLATIFKLSMTAIKYTKHICIISSNSKNHTIMFCILDFLHW